MEQLIRVNGQVGTSALFHSGDAEAFPYYYRGFGRLPVNDINYIHFDIDTTSTVDKSRFFFSLEYHMIGEVVLEWDQAALTTTGGTYRRFPDWFPFYAIDHVNLKYLSKIIQAIPQVKFFLQKSIVWDEKELERNAVEAAGELSTAERDARAIGSQHIRIRLPFYFTLQPDNYLPLFLLEKAPAIEIFWNQLSDYVQTDGTVPVSDRSNIQLRVETLYLIDSHKNLIRKMVESGISYYSRDILSLEGRIIQASNAVPYQIPLDSFTQEIPYIAIYSRKRSEVEGGMSRFRGHENLLPWSSFDISVGSKTLRDNIPYDESIYRDNFRYLNSSLGHNILISYLSENVTNENSCYGSKAIGAIQNATLNYYYESDLSKGGINLGVDDLRLDVYAPFHNIISLRQDNVQGRPTIVWEPLFI